MIFENPDTLWLLLALPPLLFGLGLWGWRAKKEAAKPFPSIFRRLMKKHIEKYITAGVLMTLLIIVLASPDIALSASASKEKTGEIALLVDVSKSMAAQADIDSPSRLDRVKSYLYQIVDDMEKLGQVKISLYGFTEIARSHVPFVGKEDYPYLKESIEKVLNINSIPGNGTGLGKPIQAVIGKFPNSGNAKLIILFSDGECFWRGSIVGINSRESGFIDDAVEAATEKGIKVVTVGVGEREGAKIPQYDSEGNFTGSYAKLYGVDYISYLNEDGLKDIASRTGGEYFLEDNLEGLIKFINDNLTPIKFDAASKGLKVYQPITNWFLLASLPIWIVFARRHLLG